MDISKLPRYSYYFAKCFFIFRNPLSVIYCYIRRISPEDQMIELRNGLKIYLSKHPHDIVTVFVILAKGDYGKVVKDSIIVDIGANIGVFALYAAHYGARKVYAYEPNREAYEVLQRNIANNKLEDIIIPYRLAVSGKGGETVGIPVDSSPYNQTLRKDTLENFELVNTITLQSILDNNLINSVDLLKVDCEGAEYEVLLKSPASLFSRIREIRMEYHQGPLDSLISYLEECKFHITRLKRDSAVLWAGKS